MTIKARIKNVPWVLLLWNEKRRIQAKHYMKKYDDLTAIKMMYKKSTGNELSLDDPRRFTEKLQWLKLFYRNKRIPICTDKYLVRKYLQDLGYGFLLNELIGVYKDVREIDFDKLPNQFVLKATHGSGWNLICSNKTKINWFWWKKIINSWMKQNLYIYGREWNYNEIKPKIIIEKYLEDDSGELRDYKVFCFNGEAKYLQIDENRFSNHKRTYIDVDGNIMGINDGYPQIPNIKMNTIPKDIFEIANNISKPFPHARIDFYICNNTIYFGEITFFDGSGFCKMNPDIYDYIFGKLLVLPEANIVSYINDKE